MKLCEVIVARCFDCSEYLCIELSWVMILMLILNSIIQEVPDAKKAYI